MSLRKNVLPSPSTSQYRSGALALVTLGVIALLVPMALVSLRRVTAYESTLSLLEDAITHQGDDAMVQNNLGNALLEQGHVEEAIQHYERSLELKPLQSSAHNNLGTLYVRTGRPQQGLEHLRRALEVWPDYPDAHNNLGAALVATGQVAEAIEHYDRATQLKPTYVEAWGNLALASAQRQQWDQAVAAAEKTVELARVQRNPALADDFERRLAAYRAQLAEPAPGR